MEIEELLEQIEITEAELEEQKEAKLKYEQDESEGFDHAFDLNRVSRTITRIENTLDSLRDRLKAKQAQADLNVFYIGLRSKGLDKSIV